MNDNLTDPADQADWFTPRGNDTARATVGAILLGMRTALIDEALTHSVIGAFFEVYNTLGFGFLEQLYARALEKELVSRGHHVKREVAVSVHYKGELLGHQRLDMVVNDKLIVEIKATENLHRDSQRQLFNYLRATDIEVGLLLHFSPSGARFFRQVCSHKPGRSAPIR